MRQSVLCWLVTLKPVIVERAIAEVTKRVGDQPCQDVETEKELINILM